MCKMFFLLTAVQKIIKNQVRFSRVMMTNVLPRFYETRCSYKVKAHGESYFWAHCVWYYQHDQELILCAETTCISRAIPNFGKGFRYLWLTVQFWIANWRFSSFPATIERVSRWAVSDIKEIVTIKRCKIVGDKRRSWHSTSLRNRL